MTSSSYRVEFAPTTISGVKDLRYGKDQHFLRSARILRWLIFHSRKGLQTVRFIRNKALRRGWGQTQGSRPKHDAEYVWTVQNPKMFRMWDSVSPKKKSFGPFREPNAPSTFLSKKLNVPSIGTFLSFWAVSWTNLSVSVGSASSLRRDEAKQRQVLTCRLEMPQWFRF